MKRGETPCARHNKMAKYRKPQETRNSPETGQEALSKLERATARDTEVERPYFLCNVYRNLETKERQALEDSNRFNGHTCNRVRKENAEKPAVQYPLCPSRKNKRRVRRHITCLAHPYFKTQASYRTE